MAAVRAHHAAPWVASLDLQRFFDHISRSRVHRALKKLGFSKDEAWEMACDSVVDKRPPSRCFSVPFGFVQSPILASLVLSKSALGKAVKECRAAGVTTTVYVDDISLSAGSEQALNDAIGKLDHAASVSGFRFNPAKAQAPGPLARSFNIEFGSGEMRILPDRLAEFEVALRTANEAQTGGILGYVGSSLMRAWTISSRSLDLDIYRLTQLSPVRSTEISSGWAGTAARVIGRSIQPVAPVAALEDHRHAVVRPETSSGQASRVDGGLGHHHRVGEAPLLGLAPQAGGA